MKNIKIALLLVLALTVVLSLASCDVVENVIGMIPGIDGTTEHVHAFGAATCETPATCECGATEGEALGHSHKAEVTAPTCTEAGYTTYTCACGDTYKADEVAALGHSHTETVTTEPTCTTAGLKTFTCACGDSYTEEIKALGHSHEAVVTDPTCTEAGYTTYTCACGDTYKADEVDAIGHSHTETVTTEPTCSTTGLKTFTCTCGDTYTEEIATLPHTEGAAATCTTAQTCTVCGKELVAKLGHVDANLDIDCDVDGCTGKVAPKADTVLSNFTANNLGSKLSTNVNYYIVGTVAEVLDARNGIFLLDDGTGELFYIRLPLNSESVTHSSWEIKLVLGDKIQVYGKVGKFTSNDAPNGSYWPSMQSGVVTILEQHPHVYTAKEADCFNPAYCECGKASSEGPKAHVDAEANDICDNCGFKMGSKVDFIKTHFNDVKETSNFDSANGTALWESEEFSILVSKGTTSFNSNGSNHFRLQRGNNLTITAKNGNKIVGIVFTVTTSTYTDELETVLTTAGIAYTLDGLELTVSVDSLDSFKLDNTASKIARIASIAVIYTTIPATEA